MSLFDSPISFAARSSHQMSLSSSGSSFSTQALLVKSMEAPLLEPAVAKTPVGHLVLLVFEAVLEVVCVSLPGYIVARQGMFDSESQKFLANLNVCLFTPCLIFTKLASQLTSRKLAELAVIPVIFVVQTLVSYLASLALTYAFGLKEKRPRNFVVAMSVFGNSNSLPISLVLSLSKTISGLHWDKIPGDNDDEVGARGILYLLIFQQLGQLLRWSWGYHVLLAPPSQHERAIEEGSAEDRYRDDDDDAAEEGVGADGPSARKSVSPPESAFDSGGQTPVMSNQDSSLESSRTGLGKAVHDDGGGNGVLSRKPSIGATPMGGNTILHHPATGDQSSFGHAHQSRGTSEQNGSTGWKRPIRRAESRIGKASAALSDRLSRASAGVYARLPKPVQRTLTRMNAALQRFVFGLWSFMNPPLWAMVAAIVVASVPSLQRAFFTPGTFVQNSVTSAIRQSGGVAVPLILVILGANLARNTTPSRTGQMEDEKTNRKLLIASVVGRMVLPSLIMAPLLALAAKYVPVSILDDPIFVVVCFLLTGAPSALQLAQICQINEVYETVMAKLLFQSYVVWILPSTLILVMTALEVVRWADIG